MFGRMRRGTRLAVALCATSLGMAAVPTTAHATDTITPPPPNATVSVVNGKMIVQADDLPYHYIGTTTDYNHRLVFAVMRYGTIRPAAGSGCYNPLDDLRGHAPNMNLVACALSSVTSIEIDGGANDDELCSDIYGVSFQDANYGPGTLFEDTCTGWRGTNEEDAPLPLTVHGGAGDDIIGDRYSDTGASPGADLVDGGDGHDVIAMGATDTVVPSAGGDTLYGTVSYQRLTFPTATGVSVTLDGVANDPGNMPGNPGNFDVEARGFFGSNADDMVKEVTSGLSWFIGMGGHDKYYGSPNVNQDTTFLETGDGDYIDGGGNGNGSNGDLVTYAFASTGVTIQMDGTPTKNDTIKNVETVMGSSHNDAIVGSAGNDTVLLSSGCDTMFGQGGTDTVTAYGSPYPVVLTEDSKWDDGYDHCGYLTGFENLIGGNNTDILIGDAGTQLLDGGPSTDWIFGGSANERIVGGCGSDLINGGGGNDWIFGSDVVYDNTKNGCGSNEANVISGGDGNDWINQYNGWIGSERQDDTIHGDGGDDHINEYGTGTVHGDADNDTITSYGNATIYGDGGENTINGGGGDTIYGGPQTDHINIDTLGSSSGWATVNGGDGNDVVTVAGPATVDGGSGSNTLTVQDMPGTRPSVSFMGPITRVNPNIRAANFSTIDGSGQQNGMDYYNALGGETVKLGGGDTFIDDVGGADTYYFGTSSHVYLDIRDKAVDTVYKNGHYGCATYDDFTHNVSCIYRHSYDGQNSTDKVHDVFK